MIGQGRRVLRLFGLLVSVSLFVACGPKRPEPVKTNEKVSHRVRVFLLAPGESGPGQEELSQAGELRALALPGQIPVQDIDLIIADDEKATSATLEPIRAVTGVEVQAPEGGAKARAAQILSHHQQTLLVMLPKAELAPLMRALEVPADSIPARDDDLDALYEIRILPKTIKARRKKLGLSP